MSRGRNKSKRREKDTHHYYFPKKLYGRDNRLMRVAYEFHHNFHNFFMGNCKYPPRNCVGCPYSLICCYEGTSIPFGRRVR